MQRRAHQHSQHACLLYDLFAFYEPGSPCSAKTLGAAISRALRNGFNCAAQGCFSDLKEAVQQLKEKGVTANQLPIKWLIPLNVDAISVTLSKSNRTIIVENNFSGQFARYLRSETGYAADGHIRKYDGEPFMPHHIVDGVLEQLAGKTNHSVPYQEVIV